MNADEARAQCLINKKDVEEARQKIIEEVGDKIIESIESYIRYSVKRSEYYTYSKSYEKSQVQECNQYVLDYFRAKGYKIKLEVSDTGIRYYYVSWKPRRKWWIFG